MLRKEPPEFPVARHVHLKVVGYGNRMRVPSSFVKARVEIPGALRLRKEGEMWADAFICIGAPDGHFGVCCLGSLLISGFDTALLRAGRSRPDAFASRETWLTRGERGAILLMMSEAPVIRIADVDSFDQLHNWLVRNFSFETLPAAQYMEADYLLCGDFGYRHEFFERVKIFFTGENHAPNLNDYDYCLTPEWTENARCFRLPYWQLVIFGNDVYRKQLDKPRPALTADELRAQHRDFCAFVCRNGACRKRNRFVRKLDARKGVHCAGPLMNNIGGVLPPGSAAKWEYVGKHLFNISYENESHPGYQTEKILDAFLARSIPVYWGSTTVTKEFNPKAFVNAHDFRSDEELIDYLLELSQDYERMAAMLNEPIFRDPQVLEKAEERLRAFFAGIFARGPLATQRTRWQRINAVLSRFYGHGLFRTFRRISRAIRGKKSNNLRPE